MNMIFLLRKYTKLYYLRNQYELAPHLYIQFVNMTLNRITFTFFLLPRKYIKCFHLTNKTNTHFYYFCKCDVIEIQIRIYTLCFFCIIVLYGMFHGK